MKKQRHPAIVAVGILNIITGSLGLLCGACAGIGNVAIIGLGNANTQGPNPIQDMLAFLAKEVPGWQAVELGRAVGVLLLGIFFVISGIGLLMMQGWARWLTIVTALFMVPLQVGWAAYEIGLVVPATQKWQAKMLKNPQFAGAAGSSAQQAGEQVGTMIGVVGVSGLFVFLSLLSAGLLFLPGVGASFAADDRNGSRDERDEEDEGPFRRRRRDDEDDPEERTYRR